MFMKEMVSSSDAKHSLRDHQFLTNSRPLRSLNAYFDEDVHTETGLAPLLELDPNIDDDLLNQCHSIIVSEMESKKY
ncbi:hypothetical protein Bhyg_12354, partial [Pseudolycoriella hygida]